MNRVVIELLVTYMGIPDIIRVSQTCKMAFKCIHSDRMWVSLLKARYNHLYYAKQIDQKRADSKHVDSIFQYRNVTPFMTFIGLTIRHVKREVLERGECIYREIEDKRKEFYELMTYDRQMHYDYYVKEINDRTKRIDELNSIVTALKLKVTSVVSRYKQLEKNRIRNQKRRNTQKRNKTRNLNRKEREESSKTTSVNEFGACYEQIPRTIREKDASLFTKNFLNTCSRSNTQSYIIPDKYVTEHHLGTVLGLFELIDMLNDL